MKKLTLIFSIICGLVITAHTWCQPAQPPQPKPSLEFQALSAKMYRLLAKQIVDDIKITKGLCLDVGCGSAQLDVELSKITDLHIIGLDIDPEAIVAARNNITQSGVGKKMSLILGDVHDLPFKNNLFDLIISRGSYPFWEDKVKAIKEIYRVLKPGGKAFIGGGTGRYLSTEEKEKFHQLLEERRQKDIAQTEQPSGIKPEKLTPAALAKVAKSAGIKKFSLVEDYCPTGCGGWIVIFK